MNVTKRMLGAALSLSLLLGLLGAQVSAVNKFSDVKQSDWFCDAVDYVSKNGLMSGTSETLFSPERTADRGMLVSILHRMDGAPAAAGAAFSDVDKSKYYAPAVSWASANGIVSGYADGRFLPESPVTREQLALILYRYTQYRGISTSNGGSLSGFADVSSVSAYASEAMRWAVGKGFITGTDATHLTPQGTATRGQLALILMRYHSDKHTGAAPKDATLIAYPISVSSQNTQTVTKSSVAIQDPSIYCGTSLTEDSLKISGNYNAYYFSGAAQDKSVLESYVNTLCSGTYNLKLVKTFHLAYSASTQFSWGLDYTGTGAVTEKMDVPSTEASCNICVFGTVDQNGLRASVWIPQEMEITDLGLRYGAQSQPSTLAGPSANAGLYKLADGSFRTTDDRLSTGIGEAAILRDGVKYTTTASYSKDTLLNREELSVGNFYQKETLFFSAPAGQTISGDLYDRQDLARNESWLNQSINPLTSADDFTKYTWTLFFGAGHDNDFITPLTSTYNEFKELTVRVMYYAPNQEAVYYIYAEFTSAPYAVEALCAVDLSGKVPAPTPTPTPSPSPTPTPGT